MEKDTAKKNIRVTKSMKTIMDAGVVILRKKEFEKIAVNDICQEALVSRSTFYTHFEDKYDLLRFSLQHFKSSLIDRSWEKENLIEMAIGEIYKKKAIFKNLLTGEAKEELRNMLYSLIEEDLINEYQRKYQPAIVPQFEEVTLHYLAGGLINVILWLVKNNFPIAEEVVVDKLLKARLLAVEQLHDDRFNNKGN